VDKEDINEHSDMKTIPVSALRIGMYVAELDRPWLETPFLLQGVLIKHQSQIDLLASLCEIVKIDPQHSLGPYYESPDDGDGIGILVPREYASFTEVARQVRSGRYSRPLEAPKVHPRTRSSPLEEEILYSSRFVEDIQKSMEKLTEALQSSATLNLASLVQQVQSLAEGVSRNSEAILWLTRLKNTDDYSYDHALDVSVHLMVFARFLGLHQPEVERLGMVGLLQDIGKVKLSPELLCRPGALSPEEYKLVQTHVESSLEILSRQEKQDLALLEIVALHHERVDGSGYPRKLAGKSLGLSAEMAGFIDAYCAIIRKRPYAPTLSTQRAIAELVLLRGTKFREIIVDQFIQCMGIYPIGSLVELNSGEVGVVIQQNQVRRLKPKVLIIMSADKKIERFPRTVDLLMNPLLPTCDGHYQIMRALPEDAYGIDPKEFYLV
jgi:HD-GYP domain-containing protein (c-di-GMP phosphodiesterase class II)